MKNNILAVVASGAIVLALSSLSVQADELWVEREVCDYTTEAKTTPTTSCSYAGELTGFHNGIYVSLSAATSQEHKGSRDCPSAVAHLEHRLAMLPLDIVSYTGSLPLTSQFKALAVENVTKIVPNSCRVESVLVVTL